MPPPDLYASTTPNSEPELLELGPGFAVYIGSERDARFIYKEIYQDHCYDLAALSPSPCTLFFTGNLLAPVSYIVYLRSTRVTADMEFV